MSEHSSEEAVRQLAKHTDDRRLPTVWRIAIVFAAAALIWVVVGLMAEQVFGAGYSRSGHILRAVLTTLLAVPVVVVARRMLDRRAWVGLGLPSLRTGWKPLVVSMVCWLVPSIIGLVVGVAFGWVEIVPLVPLGEILTTVAGLFVLVFLYEALPEELIFRGYLYRNLVAEMPVWLAVVAQAVLFMLWGIVNGGETTLERSFLFLSISILLGIVRAFTGSVWACVGFHLAFQTMAQLFGDVGGQFSVSPSGTFTTLVIGVVPFSIGLYLLQKIYSARVDWRSRQPDPA